MSNITYTTDCSHVDWEQMRDRLIEDDFHNGRSLQQYDVSFNNSAIAVIAYDGENIIGTVRVLSDGVCNAYVVDVWTYTPYRKQGIARNMLQIAEEQLAGQHVYLFTDDSVPFYEKLGYQPQPVGMGKVIGQWLQNDS